MFCTKCGSKLENDWVICPNCGKRISEEVKNSVIETTTDEGNLNKEIEFYKPSIWDKLEYWLSPLLFLLIRFNGRVEGLDGHDKFMFWFRSIVYFMLGFIFFWGGAGDGYFIMSMLWMIGGILICPLLVFRLEPPSRTRRMFTGAFVIILGAIIAILAQL